jgi:tRNA pseudouridine55 synthase
VNGVLVVNKPAGPTSHDVVAVVRRALGISRIGHTGTLDPLATGVLPLVVGKATRLAAYLTADEKEYIATVRLGATTSTYDAESASEALAGGEPPREAGAIAEALQTFLGTYLQQPPPFSAKKIEGIPAYKLARQQKPVAVKPVEVTVRELELRRYSGGAAELRIVSSSGFYVRALAHDLGQRLGCGGYLEALERSRAGDFALESARPLADIVAAGRLARNWILPMERLLTRMAAVTLTDEGSKRASHGNVLRNWDFAGGLDAGPDRLRLLDQSGTLVGIAEAREGGLLHPVVILV